MASETTESDDDHETSSDELKLDDIDEDNIDEEYRTDALLNPAMMEEYKIIEQMSPRALASPRRVSQAHEGTKSKTNGPQSIASKYEIAFQDFIRHWNLSQLSYYFLDPQQLVAYNHLILTKLSESKSNIFSMTPYLLWIFRRILQLISIALVTLFLVILYAMYLSRDKIIIPTKMDEIAGSLQAVNNIMSALYNQTDRVLQRYTESHLEPATDLIERSQVDAALQIRPKHPIVVFPGISSTALELWQSANADLEHDCQQYIKLNFRTRIWGSINTIKEVLRSPRCWLYHMMLNESTGLDPWRIKVRAADGPSAVDYLFGSYWVWAPILDNLAAVGYDTNNIFFATYDWRVSPHKLDIRDGYWSRVKMEIEIRYKITGEKSVLLGHSMGANMIVYFLQWVESNHAQGGHGGKEWVRKYIHAIIPIGGPLLGAPKVIPMYLFGEALETVLLPKPLQMMKEMIIPRAWFTRWVRSVHGGFQLAPVGGELIWGNHSYSAEDAYNVRDANGTSYGNILRFTNGTDTSLFEANCYLDGTVDEIQIQEVDGKVDFVYVPQHGLVNGTEFRPLQNASSSVAETAHHRNTRDHYHGAHPIDYDRICCKPPNAVEEDKLQNVQRNYSITDWTQVLKKLDPRTYHHLMDHHELSAPAKHVDISDEKYDEPRYFSNVLWRPLPLAPNMTVYCMYGTGLRAGRNYFYARDHNTSYKYGFRINTNYNDQRDNVVNGIRTVHGDGTVPLLSLGYMCAKGWKDNLRLNPSGAATKIIEYEDQNEPIFRRATVRGGSLSGDHVDIIGNHQLIKDILLIAMGYDHYVAENINSEIVELSQRIDLANA